MLCLQSLSLVILPYMSHSVSQSAAMCQFSGAWAAEAAPAHAAPRSPRPQPLSALCDTLSWAYSRMCWNRLWYKWCCQGAGSWSLGNERRCVEAFDNQPHSDDHLPQAACDRGNITQTGPHECRDHPAQNDRVSKQAPDGQPARNQRCPVERVAQHQTRYPKRAHADLVGIQLRLREHRAQGLKRGSVGGRCFQVLAPQWYLKQDEEHHDGNEDGVDDPGSQVADGDALVVLLQDWEHQHPVRGVANDGQQPEQRAD